MKLPNGYGSVIRLSRHRRKPYAARVTVGRTDDGKQTFAIRQEALRKPRATSVCSQNYATLVEVPVKAVHFRGENGRRLFARQ